MPSLEIQQKVKSVSLEPKRLKITDDIKPASSHFKYHFLQVSFVHLSTAAEDFLKNGSSPSF